MKKILFFNLALLVSGNLFASGTITHSTCDVVLAKGFNYLTSESTPKDYVSELKEKLEEKGYRVVKNMKVGVGHFNVASEKDTLLVTYRGGVKVWEKYGDHDCRMYIDIRENYGRSLEEIDVESVPSRFFPTKTMKCNASFKYMVKLIPECKKEL